MEEIMTELRDLMKKTIADKPAYVAGRTIEQAKKDNGGIEMIKLGSNENLMGPSPKAIEAMKEAASHRSAAAFLDPTIETRSCRSRSVRSPRAQSTFGGSARASSACG